MMEMNLAPTKPTALKGKILVAKNTRDTLAFEIKDFNQNKFILLVPIVGVASKTDTEKQDYLKSIKHKKDILYH